VLRKLVVAARYVREQEFPQRRHEVWPDDVFLVSFPRSGNTWTRFLVGNLIHRDDPVSFVNIEHVVPDIAGLSQKEFRLIPRPRVIKSHDCFDPRYRRVIYLVRDPRDVAVSSYYYAKKMKNVPDAVTIHAYITDHFMGGGDYNGNWSENVGSWLINVENAASFCAPDHQGNHRGPLAEPRWERLGARGHGREFLLVRYEDLLRDTEGGLARIARFLGVDPNPDRIRLAVERSSADRMRKLEVAQSGEWTTTRNSRNDIQFVREAKSGQWQESLGPESVATIESAWGYLMEMLGYQPVTSPTYSPPSAR
jgi:Sulfotransferase domain